VSRVAWCQLLEPATVAALEGGPDTEDESAAQAQRRAGLAAVGHARRKADVFDEAFRREHGFDLAYSLPPPEAVAMVFDVARYLKGSRSYGPHAMISPQFGLILAPAGAALIVGLLQSRAMAPEPLPREIAAIERPSEQLLKLYILTAIATVFVFPVTMVLLYFRYHTMRYRFDEEGIHMRWGILMRHEVMLNYSRIQDIQLRSNVIERWLGLARIEIQTASGSSGSEMVLEGLLNFVAVRDFLYSHMRGAHHPAGDVPESLGAVLGEVAAELRGIRQAIEQRNRQRGLQA
jgi:putative membrane protein